MSEEQDGYAATQGTLKRCQRSGSDQPPWHLHLSFTSSQSSSVGPGCRQFADPENKWKPTTGLPDHWPLFAALVIFLGFFRDCDRAEKEKEPGIAPPWPAVIRSRSAAYDEGLSF